jgi:hypothetical protein
MWRVWLEVHTGFWCGNLVERDHVKDLGVRCKYNIKLHFRGVGMEGVNWIHQAQDRDMWQVALNTLLNRRITAVRGVCWLPNELSGF